MATVYLILGAAGSTILILQFLFSIFGADHHAVDGGHDFDAGHDGEVGHDDASMFFKMLSFRAVVAAVTFFGWSGYTAHVGGLSTLFTFGIASGAGLLAMYVVAWVMRALASLHSEGNVEIDRAIGAEGRVYLSVPAQKNGVGKVHVNVQERTMEYAAVTAEDFLPTGSPIIVVGVVDEDTLEVRPLPRVEELE
ncbi:MAG: hypothetical protein SGI88_07240 [Candidatus Hydrogenedentes bacterium]|nr:hypothetical protein [Candidatus Hydrogenedentota bacterium]